MDRIFLRELKTEAVIGIADWEREVRQPLVLDLEFSADVRRAARTDSIAEAVNYGEVARRVIEFVAASRYRLVETLAEDVARLCLHEFGLEWIRLRVAKPGAVPACRDVGVEIERTRADLER